MVGRSRCCWYDVVGAWWKPRRAERVLRNCSWTQSTAYNPTPCLAQASDRIRSAGRSSCENMRLLTRTCLSRGYAPSLGVSIVLRSGTKSTAFVVPALTSSHPILTLMLWRGPSAQTYRNAIVLESRTIHSSITSWAPHYPADTEFPSEGRRSTAPGRQKQAKAGRATRFY